MTTLESTLDSTLDSTAPTADGDGSNASSRYAAVFRRGTSEEHRLVGVPEDEIRARYAQLWPADWRLRHLRGQATHSGPRYTAVWRRSLRSEVSVLGAPHPELMERYERLWAQGWRLKGVQAHPVSTRGEAELVYTAAWEGSHEPEQQVYAVPEDSFAGRYRELAGQGWRLKSLSVTTDPTTGEPRYTALWKPSVMPEIVAHELSPVVYQARYERLWVQGWRLKFLAPYVADGRLRYTAVWTRSASAEVQLPAATWPEVEARYRTLWSQGWRLNLIEPYV